MISYHQELLEIREVRHTESGNIELLLKHRYQAKRLKPGMEFILPRTPTQKYIDYFFRRTPEVLTVLTSDQERGVIELTGKQIREN